ncbi:hypothetical protein GU926_17655 [Nibribacter ruber]|uniref:Uncharacterized protein n=1 Tax=Nibribacter ruber TaxID=2698458 RepID=A0A6P1P4A3_9BACT|nr:hypothetical protein [Nibribacter ruber]QHL89158.1 hypothetical protein GU926_17655 [Nibribacter ruber]
MKIKSIILSLGLLILSWNALAQKREAMPINEIKEIIRLAVDLPELQQYFHRGADTTRTILTLQEFGLITADSFEGFEKFGHKIRIVNEETIEKEKIKDYLAIGDWTYGGKNLRLQIEYPKEELMINFRFQKDNGKWKIINSMIMEN